MTLARNVEDHLKKTGVNYDLVHHSHSNSSVQSAHAAHVPPQQVAKAVLTHDDNNYRLCVIPSSNRIVFSWLDSYMHGHFCLASEDQLAFSFNDCECGAVPAFGQVYGFPVVWDDSLAQQDDVYIEGGDHETLIHVNHGAFMELMGLQAHAPVSCPADEYYDHLAI